MWWPSCSRLSVCSRSCSRLSVCSRSSPCSPVSRPLMSMLDAPRGWELEPGQLASCGVWAWACGPQVLRVSQCRPLARGDGSPSRVGPASSALWFPSYDALWRSKWPAFRGRSALVRPAPLGPRSRIAALTRPLAESQSWEIAFPDSSLGTHESCAYKRDRPRLVLTKTQLRFSTND